MNSDVLVLELKKNNLGDVAAIHSSAFPQSAMTSLGHEAVRRYYEWQLIGPHECDALGAFRDGELLGFCFGGKFRGALSGFLRQNRLFLTREVLTHPWLLTSPFFRQRVGFGLQAMRRFRPREQKRDTQDKSASRHKSYGILSIGVDRQSQGLGVGRLLMLEAEQRARAAGFDQMHLTVHPDNVQAIGFYQRLGWKKDGQDARGNWSGRMIKILE